MDLSCACAWERLLTRALYDLTINSVAVPRLNIILSLICRDYFADQDMLGDKHFFTSSIGLQENNRQCQIPEV